jgi:hypothetical protein
MLDMIFLLLVGVITSILAFWIPEMREANLTASAGYLVATLTYFGWLAADYFWSKREGVNQKSSLVGSAVWPFWCLSGLISIAFGLLTFQFKDTFWNGPAVFLFSFLAGFALLVIWNWVSDVLYDVAQKRGKRNWN